MADTHSKETRSFNMSRIRAKNTKPELLVRSYLFKAGFRYRLYDKSLPGKPDIILPKYKTVIFVHGCFWHSHPGCRYAVSPKSNTEYWGAKLSGNAARDVKNQEHLKNVGWNVIVIWECNLKKDCFLKTMSSLTKSLICNKLIL